MGTTSILAFPVSISEKVDLLQYAYFAMSDYLIVSQVGLWNSFKRRSQDLYYLLGKMIVIRIVPIQKSFTKKTKKWARQVSNLRPSGYEPPALTTELRAPSEGDYNMAKIIPWAGFSKHHTLSSCFVFHPYFI